MEYKKITEKNKEETQRDLEIKEREFKREIEESKNVLEGI